MNKLDALGWSIRLAVKIAAGFLWMLVLRAYIRTAGALLRYAQRRAASK